MNTKFALPIILITSLIVSNPAMAIVASHFDDGSLQGWTLSGEGSDFSFVNPGMGGNPGGYALAIDNMPGGSGGQALAPAKFLGDLRGLESIQWDALLPPGWVSPVFLIVRSSSSTYKFTPVSPPGGFQVGVWQTWVAPFDESVAGWLKLSGPETLGEVLSHVTQVGFILEIATTTGNEAGLDNVILNGVGTPQSIPAMSTWGMLALAGLLGMIGFSRRRVA